MSDQLQQIIEKAWDDRDAISFATTGEIRDAVNEALNALDSGARRVAEKGADGWVVNQWLKKAVLLSFRLNDMAMIPGGPGGSHWWDKVPSKFEGWGDNHFRDAGFRAVPGAIVRHSAHIAKNVVLMPSFVNLGANVGEGTMVDTWATVGSCAQIGKNVHLSGGVGIGGVLEPLQAGPVIIEDDCFIGARSRSRRRRDRRARRGTCRWACSSARRRRSLIATPAKSSWAACPLIRLSYPARFRARLCPMARPAPALPVR